MLVDGETATSRAHLYRCYFLNGEGRFRSVAVIEGVDDADAIAKARQLHAEQDHHASFEVWEGPRRITSDHRED